ncbi:MAG: RecX family transcriptional regulator [Magnetospirillum sp.]|nr:RecX family transcriptional regulator [Magnetospirillum sp.]
MAKVPTKISPSYLENAALHYLERYASSSNNLKRVLLRKVDRSIAHWGGERESYTAQVDATIAKLARLGYLDDSAYAGMKARSLHRQGKGSRTIRAALAAKGIDAELTAAALDALTDEVGDPEFTAAVKLARKRKLGPFRPVGRAEMRNKDLAVLARAGFDFGTARRVIEAESPEALEAELG